MKYLLSFLLLLIPLVSPRGATFSDSLAFRGQGGRGPLLNGLTAYWTLDDAANSTRVDSVGSENLTDANGNVGAIGGIINNGINTTPGAATRILGHADDATLGIGAGVSFTISAWHQVDGTQDTGIVTKWSLGNAALEDYRLYVGPNGNYGNGFITWTVKNLAGTAVTIVSNFQQQDNNSCSATHFINTVCGYDDALQQIWMQVNNGPRIVAACVGVRRTACDFVVGSYMDGTTMGLAVDEVGFWRRSLTLQEVAIVNNACNGLAFASFPSATSGTANISLSVTVSTWLQTAWNNAGDSSNNDWASGTSHGITNGILTAFNRFYNTVSSAGLLSRIVALNGGAPNGVVAFSTPLVPGTGNGVWVNHGFAASDVTVNGCTGNASTKYFDTGINPSTYASQTTAGWCIYDYNTTATGFFVGVATTPTLFFVGAAKHSDNNSYSYNGSVSDVVTTPSPGSGFYSSVRTTPTDHRLYFANSGTAHAQIGATDTTTDSSNLANGTMYVMAYRDTGIGPQAFCSDTISGVVFTLGFTAADSLALYNAFQQLRVDLNGGYR